MTSLPAASRAVRAPRVLLKPVQAVGSSGPEAVELARACGLVLDDWQEAALEVGMAERADGGWAAAEVGLICSRQNGKNCVVESRELFGLVLLGERVLHTAHLFPTARESYMRLEALVRSRPDVEAQLVDQHASPASGYDMVFRSGGRIQYIARSRTSGRGFDGVDLLVLDEAQDLNDDAQGALLPTISSKPGAQAWYQGSAPDVGSTVLHRIRAQGRTGVPGPFCYLEFSADPDADLDDRAAWAQANPAHPGRISLATIESERRSMSDEMFARERLSISPDLLEAGGIFGPAWAEVCHPDLVVTIPVMFALDVNPERSAAAIVGVGADLSVSVAEYRPGTAWLVERCVELRKKYRVAFALDARGPAGSFAGELARRHVQVRELDGTAMTRACGNFYDLVVDRAVKIRTNPDLNAAVDGAARRPVGDAWAWGRKSSKFDISLLVAATIAAWEGPRRKKVRYIPLTGPGANRGS